MSDTKHCLNCNAKLEDAFCKHCGQAASTHQFTFHMVFGHDFMHAMFHFGGGFFYTLRQLFTHPGRSVREYVAGKRVKHLNYFSFLVVVLMVFAGVEAITDFNYQQVDAADADTRRIAEFSNDLLKHNPKMVFIGILPLLAFSTSLMFSKAKQNFAEHIVLNTYKQAAILFMNVLFVLAASRISRSSVIAAESLLSVLTMAYGIWFYYQYFMPYYPGRVELMFRVLVAVWMPLLVILGILAIYLGLTTP